MTPQEFDVALASALRICRAAAKEALPIEEMLEYILNKAPGAGDGGKTDEFLVSVVEAVGLLAEIGSRLPPVFGNPEPTPIRVPEPPSRG